MRTKTILHYFLFGYFWTAQSALADDNSLLQEIRSLQSQLFQLEDIKARLAVLEDQLIQVDYQSESNLEKSNVAHNAGSSATNLTQDEEPTVAPSSWQPHVDISPWLVLETEIDAFKPGTGESTSNLSLGTAAFGAVFNFNHQTQGVVTFLYEQDSTPLEVDEAFLSFSVQNHDFSIGQMYLPFGDFHTAAINDPFTLQLAESRESAMLLSSHQGSLVLQAYLYNGAVDIRDKDHIDHWGIGATYERNIDERAVSLSIEYLSNILDSDTLQEIPLNHEVAIGALSGAVFLYISPFGMSIEQVRTVDALDVKFNQHHAKPKATHAELTINLDYKNRPVVFGFSAQKTSDLLLAQIPRRRFALFMSMGIAEQIALSMEVFRDFDYGHTDVSVNGRGSGNANTGIVVQLAAEL